MLGDAMKDRVGKLQQAVRRELVARKWSADNDDRSYEAGLSAPGSICELELPGRETGGVEIRNSGWPRDSRHPVVWAPTPELMQRIRRPTQTG